MCRENQSFGEVHGRESMRMGRNKCAQSLTIHHPHAHAAPRPAAKRLTHTHLVSGDAAACAARRAAAVARVCARPTRTNQRCKQVKNRAIEFLTVKNEKWYIF